MKKLFIAALLFFSVTVAEPLIFEVRLTEGYTKKANNLVVAFHNNKPSYIVSPEG